MIESSSNKIYKEVKALKTKHTRDKTNLFFAEGERLVKSIPKTINKKYCIFSENASQEFINGFNTQGFPVYIFSQKLFKSISDTVSPQGVMCICEKFSCSFNDVLSKKPQLIIACECVSDPGNLGTIIRTADAAGASGIILSQGCADIFNPKVLRSAMGSVFNLPIFTNAELKQIIKKLKQSGIQTLAAHLKGGVTPYAVNLKKPTAILIGNEANGLTEETASAADILVKIPIAGGAESLNASVACGILIYETVRQRLEADTIGY